MQAGPSADAHQQLYARIGQPASKAWISFRDTQTLQEPAAAGSHPSARCA
jgi:hypothetical protein